MAEKLSKEEQEELKEEQEKKRIDRRNKVIAWSLLLTVGVGGYFLAKNSMDKSDRAHALKQGKVITDTAIEVFQRDFPKTLSQYITNLKPETLQVMADKTGPRNDAWGKAYDRLFVPQSPLFLRVTARRLDQSERHIHAEMDKFKLPFDEKARNQKCYCVKIDTLTNAGAPLGRFDLLLCDDKNQRYVFSMEQSGTDLTRLDKEDKYTGYVRRQRALNPGLQNCGLD